MNVLSLFSGIGGLDLGLQRAGMTIAGQVEIDPWCRKVLAKHWPEVPRHDDVRTCAGWWGGRRAPDLVCGGFPCQPVSVAGRGLAQEDPRWLWPAFAGVIGAVQPRWVIIENVPGLRRRGLADVLADLDRLGYRARPGYISACEMGASHARKRLFVLAHSRSERCHGAADSEGTRRPAPVRGETVDNARHGGGPPWRDWWVAEPGVGRMAHGIPPELDRLRGLGNAVVPQVAQHIGRLILAADGNAADRGRAA